VPVYHKENEICMHEELGELREGKLNLRKTAIMINGGSGRGSRGY